MPKITNSQPQDATGTTPAANLRLVTGYDGSPPAGTLLVLAAGAWRQRHAADRAAQVQTA